MGILGRDQGAWRTILSGVTTYQCFSLVIMTRVCVLCACYLCAKVAGVALSVGRRCTNKPRAAESTRFVCIDKCLVFFSRSDSADVFPDRTEIQVQSDKAHLYSGKCFSCHHRGAPMANLQFGVVHMCRLSLSTVYATPRE